jgi:acyl-ACP thioesterase
LPLPARFQEVYGEAAGGRTVSQRLRLPAPGADAERRAWPLRVRDFDALMHMNNAAYLEPLEDILAAPEHGLQRVVRVEAEWRSGILPGETLELAVADQGDEFRTWFLVGGEPRAACRVTLAPGR